MICLATSNPHRICPVVRLINRQATILSTMVYNLGPLGVQSTLSAAILTIGLVSIISVLYTVIRVLLSTFVLPGKPVSNDSNCHASVYVQSRLTFVSSPPSDPKAPGQSLQALQMDSAKSLQHKSRRRGSMSFSRRVHNLNSTM